MTLEQHISSNKDKNARRWTYRARDWLALTEFPRWRWLACMGAAEIVARHSRKPSTRAEAKRLLQILAHRF